MSGKTIADLREHLFATIAGVKAGTISIDQAKTISELSQVVVNTAKVEVDYVRATEGKSHFLSGEGTLNLPAPGQALPPGIKSITRHVCRDD